MSLGDHETALVLEVIDHLEGLACGEVEPWDSRQGLCRELSDRFGLWVAPGACAPSWRKYTGDPELPVPHPTRSPFTAFVRTDDLWANDEYGNNRREFCQHCADFIREVFGLEDD